MSVAGKMSMTFLLGPCGATLTGGAACVLEYARRFSARGHSVSITTWPKFLWPAAQPFPDLPPDIPVYYDARAAAASLPFHLATKSPPDRIGELNFMTAYMRLIVPAIPEADLIIANNWESVIPAWESGKGKPVHFPQHYDEVFFPLDDPAVSSLQNNPLIKLLCRNSFQMPVHRVANSSWLVSEIRRRFGETIPFVMHGIDCARFHQRPKLSLADGILRVVTYSRPDKWKGFEDAVAAMSEFLRRHPASIEWHVYGFPHAIGPRNPAAPYFFHGAMKHQDLSRLYAESDIVLCPSWYESFPLPPLEAMACGTAVITTAYGTEDYAIDGRTALVVRSRVPGDMVEALEALAASPELRARLARNGRAMAESLTWDRAVTARENLLWKIHCGAPPPDLTRGVETGIVDGNGMPFDRPAPLHEPYPPVVHPQRIGIK